MQFIDCLADCVPDDLIGMPKAVLPTGGIIEPSTVGKTTVTISGMVIIFSPNFSLTST